MSNVDIRQTLDPLLKQLEEEKSIDVAEKIISELVGLLGIKVSDRFLLNVPRIDAELSRFMLAPGFGRQAAAYDIPNDHPELIDLKLFWIKKTTKTNLSWLIGITPNYEDSDANDYKNISIDFIFPESADRLIILISDKFKIRSLELKDHVTHTQFEIFSNWKNVYINEYKEIQEAKQLVHSKLWESFNFEPINRAFYLELVESFSLLVHHLEKSFGRKPAVMFTTRLIGRLLFLWFLKKKNYINKEPGYFDVGGANDQAVYYKSKLEILFFEVLNREIAERENGDKLTPYLNGGLFDINQTDFFKDTNLTFPPGYFSSLFETLNKYNFTVDESSPEFQHVAIDPEMLGRIFESLLAEQGDDETGDNKKKATGAFYTPREIVGYMCEESLMEFLKRKLPDSPDRDLRLNELILLPETIFRDQDSNKRQAWKPYAEEIIKALSGADDEDPLTILDPAVGSGAFPMGMLHLLVKVYGRLDAKYEKNISKLKREILSKSLYGVDIEQTAIEICRLRAWLSIIVDIPEGQEVEPLPNLDFKFTCANTLIPLDDEEQATMTFDFGLKDSLMGIRDEYFNTSNKKKKAKLQSTYQELTHQHDVFDSKKTQQLKSYKPFDVGSSSGFYDPELHHGISLFDIVIGNPPYIRQEKIPQEFKKQYKKIYPDIGNGTADIYVYFFGFGLSVLKPGGVLNFITLNKYLKTKYGLELRNLLAKKYDVDLIIDFFELPVFQASTDAAITKIINSRAGIETRYFPVSTLENLNLFDLTSKKFLNVVKDASEWKFMDSRSEIILEKLSQNSISLKEFVEGKIFSGIKTGLNKAFVLTEEDAAHLLGTESSPLVRRYANSTDIKKWKLLDDSSYFLATGFDIDVRNNFPSAYKYLLQFKDDLVKRGDQGKNWWNLRPCAYYDDFDRDKIIYIHTAKNHEFYFDQEGHYINNSCYMISSNSKFLLFFLNSKLFEWLKKVTFVAYGDADEKGRAKLDFNKMVTIPVKKISPAQEHAFSIIYSKIKEISASKNYYESPTLQSSIAELEESADALIYNIFDLNEADVAVIEGT
jgi:hypothetical protein